MAVCRLRVSHLHPKCVMSKPSRPIDEWTSKELRDWVAGMAQRSHGWTIESGQSWTQFEEELRDGSRLGVQRRAEMELRVVAAENTLPLTAGTLLYRARLLTADVSTSGNPYPYPSQDMGPPSRHGVPGGRLNPPGMPYLYLAETPETAVAELRPTRGSLVSVAEFEVATHSTLFDFTREPDPGVRSNLWTARDLIARALSTPIHERDHSGYVATQFVAEVLKSEGTADRVIGVRYPSAMVAPGVNVALFGGNGCSWDRASSSWRCRDLVLVSCRECQVWKVTDTRVSSTPISPRGRP